MIQGVLRHCTAMTIERQYTDSAGQSHVGFALCTLLGFELMPRLKGIASQKLYRPVVGHPDVYAHLQPILTRPIDWDLIRQQYDEMVKYATALRLGTAEAEVKIPAASCGALEGSCLLCWGNLSPKPPNKDAIPPHRKQLPDGHIFSFRGELNA